MAEVLCVECDRPVPDKLTLCRDCTHTLTHNLHAIPALLVELTITRVGLDRGADQSHPGSPRATSHPLPIRAHGRAIVGDAALQRLENTLGTWARLVAEDDNTAIEFDSPALLAAVDEHRGHSSDPAAVALIAPTALEQAAVWLAGRTRRLRAHEAAGELARDIAATVDEIRRIVDLPTASRPVGPCPRCGTGLRVRSDDTGQTPAWVRCPGCREQHETTEVRALALQAARERLCTLDEIAQVIRDFGAQISRATLYRRAHAGKLTARGYLHRDPGAHRDRVTDHAIGANDPRVYRLGDVLDMGVCT